MNYLSPFQSSPGVFIVSKTTQFIYLNREEVSIHLSQYQKRSPNLLLWRRKYEGVIPLSVDIGLLKQSVLAYDLRSSAGGRSSAQLDGEKPKTNLKSNSETRQAMRVLPPRFCTGKRFFVALFGSIFITVLHLDTISIPDLLLCN